MSDRMLLDGSPVPEDRSHTEINPATGMQQNYIVLTPEERAKGFVKRVRRSYLHVGPPAAPASLRDLTPDEVERYSQFGYVKYEPYPEGNSSLGKYWTHKELQRAGKRCGSVTTMGTALAETYARNPRFYSGTFCCSCHTHFDLNEFEWEDGEPMDPALQEAWNAEHTGRVAREKEERRQRRIAELRKELAVLEGSG